jgi:dTDP-4-dehydrorhamnose reductase
MRILVLGSNGMAGHVITRYLKEQNYNVKTLARNNATFCVDVENDISELDNILNKENFDFVINCIGLLVKDSNDNPDKAAFVNCYLPHFIESKLKDKETKLIHLSTDCVFSGQKGYYTENDIHDEMNFYGRSKSFGEVNNNKDITFRMSIIGPEIKENGTGLFHWFVNSKENIIPGWDNAFWSGVTTLELAKCINMYIQTPKITGIYHITNKEGITKYDLLVKINKIFDLNKTIQRTQGPKTINKILIDTRKELDFNILDYDSMLVNLKNFITIDPFNQ